MLIFYFGVNEIGSLCVAIIHNSRLHARLSYWATECWSDVMSRVCTAVAVRYAYDTPTIYERFNPLMRTLKPQSNGPLYSNTVIGTLAVDRWAVTFGTARRDLVGLRPRPVPSSLYDQRPV